MQGENLNSCDDAVDQAWVCKAFYVLPFVEKVKPDI